MDSQDSLPKWMDSDPWVRREALDELDDQTLLAEVARKDDDFRVRKAAVEKVTDQTVLAEVARRTTTIVCARLRWKR